jgi:regulator of protease activity HflC (stomatin/prohibitin superfamily)
MDEAFLHDLIRLVSLTGLFALHVLVILYGTEGERRGRRTAIASLATFDWALIIGVTAGRSIASEGTPFWSLHTAKWGLLGVLLLFLPAWLLFRHGLRLSAIFLLPVTPTNREQRKQAGEALGAYAWGLNRPFYREEAGELQELVEGRTRPPGIMSPQGGPGFVMASSHYAIPFTTGTRDTRVGGHGLVFTNPKERPRTLIDLRPQIRPRPVHALTRDGIPVKVPVTAVFQVDRRRARGNWLYPFDGKAVFAAVHAQGVGPEAEDEEEVELGWDQLVVDRAADLVRDAIARTLLDRLLESDEEDVALPSKALAGGAKEKLAKAMAPHGIEVLGVGLGNIEVEDKEVLKQRVETWRASWERRRMEKEAQGEAEAIRLIEDARADAQRQMIVAITEAFQQMADSGTPVPPHVIALRFIDVLEDVAAAQPVHELLPEKVQGIPAQLRLLLEQDTPSGDDEEEE